MLRIEEDMTRLKVMGDDDRRYFWIWAHYNDFHYLILDRIFDTLFEAGQPLARWFYGHFHQSWSASIFGVIFSMLDIMEFKEVLRKGLKRQEKKREYLWHVIC